MGVDEEESVEAKRCLAALSSGEVEDDFVAIMTLNRFRERKTRGRKRDERVGFFCHYSLYDILNCQKLGEIIAEI